MLVATCAGVVQPRPGNERRGALQPLISRLGLLRRPQDVAPQSRAPHTKLHRRSRQFRPSASAAVPPLPGEHQPGDELGGKYEVLEVLGRGGNGVTYKCKSLASGGEVAVKALSLRQLRDWKQLELFEREAAILKNLDHPGIPRYLEYFEVDDDQDRGFYLVQELANGRSLGDMVAEGWRADELEVERIAGEVLQILEYLGSRRPPVIHRDIKPDNIVIEGGRTGGRVLVVDFGGVQGVASAGDRLGTTVVGTYGYMAPEQFRGGAQPASDLYGLGATLLFLLSGQPPSAFPQDRLRLNFEDVAMSPRLRLLVGGLLEPLVEDRLSARQALTLLRGEQVEGLGRQGRSMGGRGGSVGGSVWGQQQQRRQLRPALPEFEQTLQPYRLPPSPASTGRLRKPAGSRVVVTQQGPRLEIEIPPAGMRGTSLTTGAFALAWNAFVAFWTISAVAGGGVLFALFSIPFWLAGAQLAKSAVAGSFLRERLLIGLSSWRLQQQLGLAKGGAVDWDAEGGMGKKEIDGRTRDLDGVRAETVAYVNGEAQTQLVLREGVNSYVLGEGLDYSEQKWLEEIINLHIQQNKQLGEELDAFPAEVASSQLLPLEGWEDPGLGQGRQGAAGNGGSSGSQGPSYAEFLGRQVAEAAAAAGAEARAAGVEARAAGDRAAASAAAAAERSRGEAERQAEAARRAAEGQG